MLAQPYFVLASVDGEDGADISQEGLRTSASMFNSRAREWETYLPVIHIVELVLVQIDGPLAADIELGVVLRAHSDVEF